MQVPLIFILLWILAKSAGFYAPWTHPLGYINLLTFSYMVQGSTESAGIIRMVAPHFALASALVVWSFASKNKPLAGPLAALLLLATPLYFHMTAQSHIDTMRIFTFLAVFIALYGHIQRPTFGTAIIVGLAVGLSHFTHSSGILTLPILIPLYLIISGLPVKKLATYLSVIVLLGVMIILPRWLDNLAVYGSLATDQVKVWAFPEVFFNEHIAATRQLVTTFNKIWYGILKGFSYPLQFGVGHYMLIVVLIWLTVQYKPHKNLNAIWREKRWLRPDPQIYSLWILAGFYGIVILSVLLGKDLIIKNGRYLLTIQPFVVLVVASTVAKFITIKFHSDANNQTPVHNPAPQTKS